MQFEFLGQKHGGIEQQRDDVMHQIAVAATLTAILVTYIVSTV